MRNLTNSEFVTVLHNRLMLAPSNDILVEKLERIKRIYDLTSTQERIIGNLIERFKL